MQYNYLHDHVKPASKQNYPSHLLLATEASVQSSPKTDLLCCCIWGVFYGCSPVFLCMGKSQGGKSVKCLKSERHK